MTSTTMAPAGGQVAVPEGTQVAVAEGIQVSQAAGPEMLLSTPIDGSESKVETEAKSGDLTLIGTEATEGSDEEDVPAPGIVGDDMATAGDATEIEGSAANSLVARRSTEGGFRHFGQLPFNVRQKILGYAADNLMYDIPSHVVNPEMLFRSLGNRIPGIVQACRLARANALLALAIEFRSTISLNFRLALYKTFHMDTISIHGEYVVPITQSRIPEVATARADVRHIICVDVDNMVMYGHTRDMAIARIVLMGSIGFWPSLESWSFPGYGGAVGDGRNMEWTEVQVARPRSRQAAKYQIVRTARRISHAMNLAFIGWTNQGIGLRIVYTCPEETLEMRNYRMYRAQDV